MQNAALLGTFSAKACIQQSETLHQPAIIGLFLGTAASRRVATPEGILQELERLIRKLTHTGLLHVHRQFDLRHQ
jgi:NAD+--asparagine ADP-ribosyltransferase